MRGDPAFCVFSENSESACAVLWFGWGFSAEGSGVHPRNKLWGGDSRASAGDASASEHASGEINRKTWTQGCELRLQRI